VVPKETQNERNDEFSYLKARIKIMSERMIPGGVVRSDARGSACGRRFIQERLLLAFLNTGMWVAGEKHQLARVPAFLCIARESRMQSK